MDPGRSRSRARTTESPPRPSPAPPRRRTPPSAWPRTAPAGGGRAWREAPGWRWSRPQAGRSSSALMPGHRTPVTTARSSCASTAPEPPSRCCHSPEPGRRTRRWISGSCGSSRPQPRIRSSRQVMTTSPGPTSATSPTPAVSATARGGSVAVLYGDPADGDRATGPPRRPCRDGDEGPPRPRPRRRAEHRHAGRPPLTLPGPPREGHVVTASLAHPGWSRSSRTSGARTPTSGSGASSTGVGRPTNDLVLHVRAWPLELVNGRASRRRPRRRADRRPPAPGQRQISSAASTPPVPAHHAPGPRPGERRLRDRPGGR